MDVRLPDEVRYIIDSIEKSGYEAFAVGGCVRDSLLGKQARDWDICTSALPEQTMECFRGQPIIETGLHHGTVTLLLNHNPYEITTYRIDGDYADSRHPDTVEFVGDLKVDLSRRDFTIGAMAYNPRTGIIDLFGGADDLKAGIVRCVGSADKRFQEDALRIMRALRFASVLGFAIDGDTARAMLDNKRLLGHIAVERIATELNKLLVGSGVCQVLSEYIGVIAEIIPELTPTVGFRQNNPYHCHDVLNHILFSVGYAPPDVILRLAMLFHDIAKPACCTVSDDGIGHFYGHAKASAEMARVILSRLKYPNEMKGAVVKLVLYHDVEIFERQHIKRWLNRIGETRLRQLLEVKRADTLAQAEAVHEGRLPRLSALSEAIDEIIAQRQCFSLKDLAVDGRDLLAAGVPGGPEIGALLKGLLRMVIDEKIANDKTMLLEAASKLRNGRPG